MTSWNRIITAAAPSGAGCGTAGAWAWPLVDGAGRLGVSVCCIGVRTGGGTGALGGRPPPEPFRDGLAADPGGVGGATGAGALGRCFPFVPGDGRGEGLAVGA